MLTITFLYIPRIMAAQRMLIRLSCAGIALTKCIKTQGNPNEKFYANYASNGVGR